MLQWRDYLLKLILFEILETLDLVVASDWFIDELVELANVKEVSVLPNLLINELDL